MINPIPNIFYNKQENIIANHCAAALAKKTTLLFTDCTKKLNNDPQLPSFFVRKRTYQLFYT